MNITITTSLGELKSHDRAVRNWLCKRDEYLKKWIRENMKNPAEGTWDAEAIVGLTLEEFDKQHPAPSIVPK